MLGTNVIAKLFKQEQLNGHSRVSRGKCARDIRFNDGNDRNKLQMLRIVLK